MADMAEYFVNVVDYSEPSEIRPKDDQAIVFEADKDVPIEEYLEELNKSIDDRKSFIYGNRISNDRILVVMATSEQASLLVEKVKQIKVNNKVITLKFYVAKAVKVIISNALYGVTNSSIKKFLTRDCKIRTFSSVTELRTSVSVNNRELWDVKSYRRFIYIHPEDINNLPKKPVKFNTPTTSHYVYFELDDKKCRHCHQLGHFKINCPQNQQTNNNESTDSTERMSTLDNDGKNEASYGSPASGFENKSDSNRLCNPSVETSTATAQAGTYAAALVSASSKALIHESLSPSYKYQLSALPTNLNQLVAHQLSTDHNTQIIAESTKQPNKRLRSITSSEKSSIIDESIAITEAPSQKLSKSQRKKARKTKQRIVLDEQQILEKKHTISSQLETAHAHIDASFDKFKVSFDDFVDLVTKSSTSPHIERKTLARSYLNDSNSLVEMIKQVYSLVIGTGIRQKLTILKKAIENEDTEITEYETEASQASDIDFLTE